jgi:acid phosphatase type 7
MASSATKSLLAGLTVLAAVAPSSAQAATAVFSPTDDAYVSSAKQNTNYGASSKLSVDGSPTLRSYLKFQITGLPSDASIDSASLRLYATKGRGASFQVHDGVMDLSWSEDTITYATAPSFGSMGISGAIGGTPAWTEVDVKPFVGGNGVTTLVLTTTGSTAIGLASEETANDPQLVVDYTGGSPPPPPPPGGDPILVGAGDIAATPSGASGGDEATARLLDSVVAANPGNVTVFTAGDNAYESGTLSEYMSYYDPTWGRQKALAKPTPGNHEYATPGAAGYFDYFGAAAGNRAEGYYAYNLGAWRIYSLNSEIAHGVGSAQEQWLRGDLTANASKACVLAYWHRPRFSSGTHGSDASMQALWQALYDNGAEVVVSGHDHNYQRFAPQTPSGVADAARGIREFVVGTGGRSHYVFTSPIANTQAYNTDTYGVLRLTLHPTSYDFAFLPEAGRSYSDGGTSVPCH